MPLGLKVMVLSRVAPGHGACTVPKGGQWTGCGMESAGWDTGPQEPQSSPGDIQKDDALRFQVLNLGGQVYSITLHTGTGSVGNTGAQVTSLLLVPMGVNGTPYHYSDVLG